MNIKKLFYCFTLINAAIVSFIQPAQPPMPRVPSPAPILPPTLSKQFSVQQFRNHGIQLPESSPKSIINAALHDPELLGMHQQSSNYSEWVIPSILVGIPAAMTAYKYWQYQRQRSATPQTQEPFVAPQQESTPKVDIQPQPLPATTVTTNVNTEPALAPTSSMLKRSLTPTNVAAWGGVGLGGFALWRNHQTKQSQQRQAQQDRLSAQQAQRDATRVTQQAIDRSSQRTTRQQQTTQAGIAALREEVQDINFETMRQQQATQADVATLRQEVQDINFKTMHQGALHNLEALQQRTAVETMQKKLNGLKTTTDIQALLQEVNSLDKTLDHQMQLLKQQAQQHELAQLQATATRQNETIQALRREIELHNATLQQATKEKLTVSTEYATTLSAIQQELQQLKDETSQQTEKILTLKKQQCETDRQMFIQRRLAAFQKQLEDQRHRSLQDRVTLHVSDQFAHPTVPTLHFPERMQRQTSEVLTDTSRTLASSRPGSPKEMWNDPELLAAIKRAGINFTMDDNGHPVFTTESDKRQAMVISCSLFRNAGTNTSTKVTPRTPRGSRTPRTPVRTHPATSTSAHTMMNEDLRMDDTEELPRTPDRSSAPTEAPSTDAHTVDRGPKAATTTPPSAIDTLTAKLNDIKDGKTTGTVADELRFCVGTIEQLIRKDPIMNPHGKTPPAPSSVHQKKVAAENLATQREQLHKAIALFNDLTQQHPDSRARLPKTIYNAWIDGITTEDKQFKRTYSAQPATTPQGESTFRRVATSQPSA